MGYATFLLLFALFLIALSDGYILDLCIEKNE